MYRCLSLVQHDIRPLFLERGGHELEEVAGAVAATTSLLDSLLELQEACLERSADAAVKTAAQKRKRPHGADPERYWKYMKSVGDRYAPVWCGMLLASTLVCAVGARGKKKGGSNHLLASWQLCAISERGADQVAQQDDSVVGWPVDEQAAQGHQPECAGASRACPGR